MCGIIGYLGDREATPILMESLKRLEYRGYDSAGVAVLELPRAGEAVRTSVTKSEAKVDTEVVPHLIEANYKGDFLAAVRAALKRIKGAYALAMFSSDDPELLVGARLNAPLVVGIGDNEYYIASDITAIIPYTKRVLVLGEGEVAAVTPLGAEVSTLDGVTVNPKIVHVDWDVSQAQKGGYPHFMLKEINETPE